MPLAGALADFAERFVLIGGHRDGRHRDGTSITVCIGHVEHE